MTKKTCEYSSDVITLKANMQNMQKDLTDIKTTLHEFIETADKKYADNRSVRRLESVVYGGLSVVFTFILLAVLTFIFNK